MLHQGIHAEHSPRGWQSLLPGRSDKWQGLSQSVNGHSAHTNCPPQLSILGCLWPEDCSSAETDCSSWILQCARNPDPCPAVCDGPASPPPCSAVCDDPTSVQSVCLFFISSPVSLELCKNSTQPKRNVCGRGRTT